jgi:hypothetical protein
VSQHDLTDTQFHDALMTKKQCFLNSTEWESVLYLTVVEDHPFSDRTELIVSMWTTAACLPGYLQTVIDIICNPSIAVEVKSIKTNLKRLAQSLSQWQKRYQVYSAHNRLDGFHKHADADKEYEALGFSLTCLTITNRLIYALDPLTETAFEEEAQELAAQVVAVEQNASSINARAKLFMPLKVHVAGTTRLTAEKWRKGRLGCSMQSDNCTLPKVVFVEWCHLTGWKTD